VWNLKSPRAFAVVRQALSEGGERFGIRICEFSMQGDEVHIIAEADDARSLSHGMQGFGIRLAKGLNGLVGRSGRVFADRFDARILRTPNEVVGALRDVRQHAAVDRARPARPKAAEPISSGAPKQGIPLAEPRTHLLLRAQAGKS
jgi:hypothetical protein